MHDFKGAIFDMDGTLLDSMPVWKRLTQGYLSQFGLHITDQDYAVTEGLFPAAGGAVFHRALSRSCRLTCRA